MNPLTINKDSGGLYDKVDALINVVNLLTDQMYQGRVKQAQEDIAAQGESVNKLLTEMKVSVSALIENGLFSAGEIEKILSHWMIGFEYVRDEEAERIDRVIYNNAVYECLLSHTSIETWTPDAATSLWKKLYDLEEKAAE